MEQLALPRLVTGPTTNFSPGVMGGERVLLVFRENWEYRFELEVKAYIIGQLSHLSRQVMDAKLTMRSSPAAAVRFPQKRKSVP